MDERDADGDTDETQQVSHDSFAFRVYLDVTPSSGPSPSRHMTQDWLRRGRVASAQGHGRQPPRVPTNNVHIVTLVQPHTSAFHARASHSTMRISLARPPPAHMPRCSPAQHKPAPRSINHPPQSAIRLNHTSISHPPQSAIRLNHSSQSALRLNRPSASISPPPQSARS